MEAKYLKKFKNLEDKKHLYRLNGGRVLVEILPAQEIKTAGGLIVHAPSGYAKGSTADTCRGTLGVVLLVGEGYIGADGTEYEMGVKPGTICLINDFSIRAFSIFPGLTEYSANSIALIDEANIQMQWDSMEQFLEYEAALNIT